MTPETAIIRLLAIFHCRAHLCTDSTTDLKK